VQLRVPQTATLKDVKSLLGGQLGIDPLGQCLLFDTKALEGDAATLQELKVVDGSELQLLVQDTSLKDLEEAKFGLEMLGPSEIREIRSMVKPPETVLCVCNAARVLLGQAEEKVWKDCRKNSLDDTHFLSRLMGLNLGDLKPGNVNQAEKLLEKVDEVWLDKVNLLFVKCLLAWVRAIIKCYRATF